MDTQTLTLTSQKYVAEVTRMGRVEEVRLFGSVASGRHTENSDIDILVVGQFPKIPAAKRHNILNTLPSTQTSYLPFNVYYVTPRAFARARAWSLLGEAKRTSMLVWKKD